MQFNEEDIGSITESVWGAVLSLGVVPTPNAPLPEDGGDHLIGSIGIRGEWNGSILIACPAALARRVAGIMFDVDPTTATTTQIEDALCEVTNMTGGNIKPLLPEPCHLELPQVLRGGERTRVLATPVAAHVRFECEGQGFSVTVHEEPGAVATPHASA